MLACWVSSCPPPSKRWRKWIRRNWWPAAWPVSADGGGGEGGRGGVFSTCTCHPHSSNSPTPTHSPPPLPLTPLPQQLTAEISGHTKGFKARSLLNATVGEGDLPRTHSSSFTLTPALTPPPSPSPPYQEGFTTCQVRTRHLIQRGGDVWNMLRRRFRTGSPRLSCVGAGACVGVCMQTNT